ncbi:MAG TPA: carbonic anhydrase [Candidatus Dormibacteraeota bacterium]|nr:carbonic anhydrase [Candidatus Dormibacteraeota bacterium]
MMSDDHTGAAAEASAALPPASRRGLRSLLDGNARFAEGTPRAQPHTASRVALANRQEPFAVVLGCADSRVPVETIFDQEPGNVFVVRLAGNIADEDAMGSIEYAVAVLKASLILVLGHSSCGAVTAAVSYVRDAVRQPGYIQRLVDAIEPAARAVERGEGDWIERAVVENARMNAAKLRARSAIVAEAVGAGALGVAAGVYDLRSGKVTLV